MHSFNVLVADFHLVYNWMTVSFGEEMINAVCWFEPTKIDGLHRKMSCGSIIFDREAATTISVNDDDMAMQMKLCWGELFV